MQTGKTQIIFTDVSPDVTVDQFNQGYQIDFNDDEKIDVHLTLLSNTGVWVMRLIPDDSEDVNFVINTGGANGGATVLNIGDNIFSGSNWYQIGSGWGDLLFGHWDSSGNYGYWTDTQTDKYLGIKFKIGTNYYYGWIFITTIVTANDDMQFTMQSFAYNSVAGEAILAGDEGQGVNIKNISDNNICVSPNPADNFINISNNNDITKISILNTNSQIVKNISNSNNLQNIDISDLKSGLYLLKIWTKCRIITKKVFKK